MSLRHAVLGFLSVEPFTGYDLKKAFDRSVRHLWASDKAALYRMLAELERDGLARSRVVPQHGRPDRHVYEITDAGAVELDRWLRAPIAPPQRREPFLLQLFFSDRLSAAERDGLFDRELASVQAEIATLHEAAAAIGGGATLTGPLLTLHAGLASLAAWRDWLVQARGLAAQGPEALRDAVRWGP